MYTSSSHFNRLLSCVCVCVCVHDVTEMVDYSPTVIIMCANADSIREIMITAAQNNFDNGDYVFFNIDLFSR